MIVRRDNPTNCLKALGVLSPLYRWDILTVSLVGASFVRAQFRSRHPIMPGQQSRKPAITPVSIIAETTKPATTPRRGGREGAAPRPPLCRTISRQNLPSSNIIKTTAGLEKKKKKTRAVTTSPHQVYRPTRMKPLALPRGLTPSAQLRAIREGVLL